jgi:hypothetical protein
MADQRASCGTDGRTDQSASSPAATSDVANDRAGTGAGSCPLPSWRIAGIETERGEQNAANHCENFFAHDDLFVSPLNRRNRERLRSRRANEHFVHALVQDQVPDVGLSLSAIINIARIGTFDVAPAASTRRAAVENG